MHNSLNNFGLTCRKGKKQMTLYYYFVVKGVVHKINSGVKTYHVDLKKWSVPDIEDELTLLRFRTFVLSHWSELSVMDWQQIVTYIGESEMNPNPKPRTPKASNAIVEAFNRLYDKESSTYKTYETYVNRYLEYLKTVKGDSLDKLKKEWLIYFRSWLVEQGLGVSTINDTVGCICRILNYGIVEEAKYRKYGLERVVLTKIKKKVAREDEKIKLIPQSLIDSLMSYVPKNKREDECIKWFKLLISTGLRYSDVEKLIAGDYVDNENGTYSLKTKKKSIYAHVVVTDEIKQLISDLQGSKLVSDYFNRRLKIIVKSLDNTTKVKFDVQKGRSVHTEEKYLYEVISAHYMRHTFITQRLAEGENIMTIARRVGHKDDAMIRRVYGHLTMEQDNEVFVKKVGIRKKTLPDVEVITPEDLTNERKRYEELYDAVQKGYGKEYLEGNEIHDMLDQLPDSDWD